MRTGFVPALCLVALAMIATSAGATTLLKLNNSEMTAQADVIVVGRCASAESRWIGRSLVTLVRVEVEQALKGFTARELTLVIPGGVDASREVPIAVTFPGAPNVFRDENVLLFLGESAVVPGGYDVVGFNQGKYSVVEDSFGERMVTRGGASAVSLEEMKRTIQKHLRDSR